MQSQVHGKQEQEASRGEGSQKECEDCLLIMKGLAVKTIVLINRLAKENENGLLKPVLRGIKMEEVRYYYFRTPGIWPGGELIPRAVNFEGMIWFA